MEKRKGSVEETAMTECRELRSADQIRSDLWVESRVLKVSLWQGYAIGDFRMTDSAKHTSK